MWFHCRTRLEPYDKGGYIFTFELAHPETDWRDFLFAVLLQGKRLGSGWCMHGFWPNNAPATTTSCHVPGVTSADWYAPTHRFDGMG